MNDIDHKVAGATEVFGRRKKKMLERRERRITRNQDYSKFHHIWNSTIRHQLQAPVGRLIQKIITEFKAANIPATQIDTQNAHIVMNMIGSDPGTDISICSIDYWDEYFENNSDNEDIWEDLGDKLEDIVTKVENSKEYKEVRAICPHITVGYDYIDDYAGVGIYTSDELMNWVVKKFSSFDSFIYAMESNAGDTVKVTVGTAAGILTIVGIGYLTIKFWYVIVALYGIGALMLMFGDAGRKKALAYDRKNPSPEEQESLKVFESKYYPLMKNEAKRLETAIRSDISDIDGVSVSFHSSAKPTDDPYSKMFIPVATIGDTTHSNIGDAVTSTQSFDKLIKVIEEIDNKYNRKIEVKAIHKSSKNKQTDYDIGISFGWIDSDGFILPNLK